MLNFNDFVNNSLSQLSPMLQRHWEIDHVCYRTESLREYEQIKKDLTKSCQFLIESEVGGRPISTFKTSRPIKCTGFYVDLIELPAPKSGKNVKSGLEHLEVVIDLPFQELMSKFPDIDWNTSALHKELNPELQTSFTDFNVKFHYHSLEQIINIEKNQKVVAFLKESQLLNRFSKFHPLITGTIPLAINIETSDLDILFQSENFEEFTKHVLEFFPKSVIRIEQDYVLAIFKHNDLNIEFFCQKIHPLKQRAHQHLRIEARLLKLLGVHFRRRIIQLKREGFKTEPAFGELLALDNPYEDLLQLNTLSDIDLLQRFSHLKDL